MASSLSGNMNHNSEWWVIVAFLSRMHNLPPAVTSVFEEQRR